MTPTDPPPAARSLVAADRLGPYLAAATGEPGWKELDAELISGGKSNLTFVIRSSVGELVLRRPPTGSLLPTAHDMGREYAVQLALAGSGVPVAGMVVHESTGEVIGVPFYVMERVHGHVIRGELPAGYATTDRERVGMAGALIDALARLHSLDPAERGLADFGRPAGFVERQVRRWHRQWEASKVVDVPEIDALVAALRRRIPAELPPGIVHGDFKLDNCLLAANDPGRIAAILDWEMSTLGDPRTDLALLLLYWREAGEGQPALVPTVTDLPGFPGRDWLTSRYEQATGRPVEDLPFFQGLAHFKFAVIAQGVSARSKAGAMAGQNFVRPNSDIAWIAARGLELLS